MVIAILLLCVFLLDFWFALSCFGFGFVSFGCLVVLFGFVFVIDCGLGYLWFICYLLGICCFAYYLFFVYFTFCLLVVSWFVVFVLFALFLFVGFCFLAVGYLWVGVLFLIFGLVIWLVVGRFAGCLLVGLCGALVVLLWFIVFVYGVLLFCCCFGFC